MMRFHANQGPAVEPEHRRGGAKGGRVCRTPSPRSRGPCLSLLAHPLRAMGGPRALLATLWALGAAGAAALRIGAFNIQSFGDSKVSDPACGGVIAQVRPGPGDGVAAGRRGRIRGA